MVTAAVTAATAAAAAEQQQEQQEQQEQPVLRTPYSVLNTVPYHVVIRSTVR